MKTLKLLAISLLLTLFSTGCVHKIDKQGLTLNISESQLNSSFDDSFPIKNDFVFGTIEINSPKITIPKGTNRINANINMNLSTFLTKTQYGTFTISGYPYFEKKTSSIFLKDVKIDNFSFAQLQMGKGFSQTFLKAFEPMVNQAFKKFPIYKIPKDSFQGSFVKNIKIEESQLLVTYGI